MNQKEIEALIEKAKAGDADAQYMFGLLNSLNGYYEQACGYIKDAAKQKHSQTLDWISRHKKLTEALASVKADTLTGLQIKIWNAKKGEQSEAFGMNALSDGAVLVIINKDDEAGSPFNFAHFHSELIKEEYFHIMYDRWELYLAGKLMAKDIKPAKNAKYLISIIHYMLENNAELRRQ